MGGTFLFSLGVNFAFQFFFLISPWTCQWKETQGVHWRMAHFISYNRHRRRKLAKAQMTSMQQLLLTMTILEKTCFSKPDSRRRILELNQVWLLIQPLLCRHCTVCSLFWNDMLWIVLARVTVCIKHLKAMRVIYSTEADESNGSISSEEDLDYKTFSLKQTVPKKSISQIIKDKKKQTHLTLQWYPYTKSECI